MSYLTNRQPHDESAMIDVMMRTDPLQTLALLAEQERSLANAAQRVYMNHNNYNNGGVGMVVQHGSLPASLYQPQPLVMQSNYDTSSWDSFRSLSLPPPSNSAVAADAAADLMTFSNHRRPMVNEQNFLSAQESSSASNEYSSDFEMPANVILPKADDVNTRGKPAASPDMQNFSSAQAQESSSSASNEYSSDIRMPVKVGRIRYYDQSLGKYGQWQDILGSETITINLSRGGTLRILRNILQQDKRKELSRSMHSCKLYRQYSLSRNDRLNFTGFKEPRSHVLLSSRVKSSVENGSNNEHPGYSYHGVQMKAFPIDKVPEVENYAEELARMYNLPLNQWDIGVDMILYKDGGDSIGWHADDTQGESIVVCVVVDAPGEIRPLHIRPNKRAKALSQGDEEIQLFIAEGDGYDMNGLMQSGYEHSLPKRVKDNSHRFVLIFRHGRVGFVPQDSGEKVLINEDEDVCSAINKLRPKVDTILFGHPSLIQEGDSYPRRHLWTSYAHRADQRGINGNIRDGSDSIVVSRQSFALREEDGLSWLRYTSSRRQGGGALCVSYRTKKPVRVFRSSRLEGPYRPPAFDEDRTSYRYDGLYVVTRVWDSVGSISEDDIPTSGAFTFHLERLPQPENALSTDDLFRKIQMSRHCEHPLPFTVPEPKNRGDVLPTLIESAPKVAFRQPISIDYGATKELERFASATSGEIATIVKRYCERKSKDKTKKERKKADKIKKERKKAGLTTDIVHAIFACVIDNKSPPENDFKIIITEQSKLSPPPFDYHGEICVEIEICVQCVYDVFNLSSQP
jgi:alkylated DNA repair dioxygenase AlkB